MDENEDENEDVDENEDEHDKVNVVSSRLRGLCGGR